jgi:pimeloyl-ACP methyl ester carboxylesterase
MGEEGHRLANWRFQQALVVNVNKTPIRNENLFPEGRSMSRAILAAADVVIPERARNIVLFAHGSGSSRLSPRNRHVAAQLNGAGFATILFDLLAPGEAADRHKVFDQPLMGQRMSEAAAEIHAAYPDLSMGLYGASTGAAAALHAAVTHSGIVRAVVSRGGRPDLAQDVLSAVRAPTLLIVGGLDEDVIPLNERALAMLSCEKELAIVDGATHLFEEAGALDQVVQLAIAWFHYYLGGRFSG